MVTSFCNRFPIDSICNEKAISAIESKNQSELEGCRLNSKNVDFEKFNASMIKHDDILSQHVDILIVGLGVGFIMKKGLKSHARILTV